MIWPVKFFKPVEFDSPDLPGSGEKMSLDTIILLEKTRIAAGIPFKIASGFRTEAHNRAVGGVRDSAHRLGKACDVTAVSSRTRFLIMRAAFLCGWNRIGFGSTFIHLDNDLSKPVEVLWTYKD